MGNLPRGEKTVGPELLREVYPISQAFRVVAFCARSQLRPALLDAQSTGNLIGLVVIVRALEPCAVETADELMRLLLFFYLLPVENHVSKLIKIDGIHISLSLDGLPLVPSVFGIAGAEPALREEALDGEAGLSPDVEVVAELNSEGMRFQRLSLVQGRAVVVETIEEFVEVDGLYFLFLFLGVHLLKLYWAGDGRITVRKSKGKGREGKGEQEGFWLVGGEYGIDSRVTFLVSA